MLGMEIDSCYTTLAFTIAVVSIVSYMFLTRHLSRPASGLPLPPGTTGWPYIGETLQLFSQNPNVFFAEKQRKYGEIFKSHVLGYPSVMLASPEAVRFVLVSQADLFKPTYPNSKQRIMGPWGLFFHQGDYHARLRHLMQSALMPDSIRALMPSMEAKVVSLLDSWDGQELSTFRVMKKFSLDMGFLAIFGGRLDQGTEAELKKYYAIVDKGYNSFPIDLPGTRFNKSIKARRVIGKIFNGIIEERRRNGVVATDLLGWMMDSVDEKTGRLTDDQIADNMIGLLFAAQDTTASAMTWAIKYLHDDPKLLEAIKAEQMSIFEANEKGSLPLTWAQTRSMVLTHKFILETLRMSTILSFTFREAVADVEYKGYLIPKGWKVMPLFRNIHHNPDLYPDPLKLDPSRFKTAPKPNTYVPFGNGAHACPGNELAKLEIMVMLHHLVTKYRVELVGTQGEFEYSPFLVPKRGLPARVWRESRASGTGTATGTATSTHH